MLFWIGALAFGTFSVSICRKFPTIRRTAGEGCLAGFCPNLRIVIKIKFYFEVQRNIRAITFSLIIQIIVIAACIIWAIVLIIGIADYDYGGGDGTILERGRNLLDSYQYNWNEESKTWLIVGLFVYAGFQAIILAVTYRARNELRLAVPPADAY